MDFFSISENTGFGLIPTMDNLKFIWLYFLAFLIMSSSVFSWWYYKHTSLAKKEMSGLSNQLDVEHVEGRMEALARADRAFQRRYAKEKLDEANYEWEKLPEEASKDDIRKVMLKRMFAEQALETGVAFNQLSLGVDTN